MYVNVFKTQTPPLLCTNKGLNPNFPGTLIAVQFLEKVGDAAIIVSCHFSNSIRASLVYHNA